MKKMYITDCLTLPHIKWNEFSKIHNILFTLITPNAANQICFLCLSNCLSANRHIYSSWLDALSFISNSCLILHPLFDWQPAKVQALFKKKKLCTEAWGILDPLTEWWRWTALLVTLSIRKGQAAYQANEKVKVKALGRSRGIVLISAQRSVGIKVQFRFE